MNKNGHANKQKYILKNMVKDKIHQTIKGYDFIVLLQVGECLSMRNILKKKETTGSFIRRRSDSGSIEMHRVLSFN